MSTIKSGTLKNALLERHLDQYLQVICLKVFKLSLILASPPMHLLSLILEPTECGKLLFLLLEDRQLGLACTRDISLVSI